MYTHQCSNINNMYLADTVMSIGNSQAVKSLTNSLGDLSSVVLSTSQRLECEFMHVTHLLLYSA